MLGKGLLKGLGITAKHTFEREITQQYPEERPFLQDRYRGSLEYDYPKCIACGQCIKACPNNVLTLDTYRDEGSKKKKVERYVIDLQYCLFCNLCVEICPTNTLYFSHDFELTRAKRGDIMKVYHRQPELELVPAGKAIVGSVSGTPASPPEEPETTAEEDAGRNRTEAPQVDAELSEADSKRLQQFEAMKGALVKNPAKTLAKILPDEADAAVMTSLINGDEKKLTKLAELLVDDRDKAAKLAAAWVAKEKKSNPREGGEAK